MVLESIFLSKNPYTIYCCIFITILLLLFIQYTLTIELDPSHLSLLKDSVTSCQFKSSSTTLVASSVPMIIDLILDIMYSNQQSLRNPKFIAARIGRATICISGLTIGVIWSLFPLHFEGFKSLPAYYLFTVSCLRAILGISMWYLLNIANSDLFTFKQTLYLSLYTSFGTSSQYIAIMYDSVGSYNLISSIFSYGYLLSYLVIYCAWMSKLFRTRDKWTNDNSKCLFYTIMSFFIVFSMYFNEIADIISMNEFANRFNNSGSELLAIDTYAFAVTVILISIVPGRIARLEAIAAKDHIIETRKAYVRYISHELRNPLNTVFMGLKLLSDQVGSNINEEKSFDEIYDSIRDTTLACNVALDILNDLLLFDKLESGIMELRTQEVNVIELVEACVSMHQSAMRSKDIKSKLTNGKLVNESNLKSSNSKLSSVNIAGNLTMPGNAVGLTVQNLKTTSAILMNDVIQVDRNKICQIIRNFLCNAIKFTPTGGNIEICLKFVQNLRVMNNNNLMNHAMLKQQQSLWKLVDNGFQSDNVSLYKEATHDGKNLMASAVCAESSDNCSLISGYLVIDVIDDGVGISEENQKRLFKEIVQFKPEELQSGGGSGLGMWISKEIADLHDGIISVFSRGEGFGSTFRVEIPMIRKLDRAIENVHLAAGAAFGKINYSIATHDHKDQSVFCSNSQTNVAGTVRPLRILVVDDSQTSRKMLVKILKMRGNFCDEASDGLEAITKCKNKLDQISVTPSNLMVADFEQSSIMYDCILMDSIMPNVSGPEATAKIKKLGYNGHIIGVTGNTVQDDVDSFIKAGASHVLSKPVEVDALTRILNNLGNS